MDSEDDMHDFNDVDCFDDDDGDMYDTETGSQDYDDASESQHDDSSEQQPQPKQQNYTVMKEEDIRSRLEEDIKTICDVLTVPRSSAIILLRHYHWRVDSVQSEWFSDEEKVRKAVGLFEKPLCVDMRNSKLTCGICFDDYHSDEMYDVGCGHLFCESCWEGYIGTSINDGPGCLMLRCPDPPCSAAVCQDMVDKLVCDEGKEKYYGYLLRSYIEDNKTIKVKWCPAPGCGSAVQIENCVENFDVSCECTNSFCWNCIEEGHHPVECKTVEEWNTKNTSEGENVTWILAYSKPCPNCKRPIEKNQGCNSMRCSQCGTGFCWACLKPTNNHYACNGYEDKSNSDEGRIREMAKNSLAKYTHYYERWAGNHKSKAKAVKDLQKVKSVHIQKLCGTLDKPETEFEFITKAWMQIIDCRRFLKWTYAYGYYMPEYEKTKKQLFEYLQGEAEQGLERLHECAEKELQPYLGADPSSEGFDAYQFVKDFGEFRKNLVGLTSVTRNYFANLVRGLANGLSEVDNEKDKRVSAIEEYKREGRKYGFYNSDDEDNQYSLFYT